jgi:hypothetical protein
MKELLLGSVAALALAACGGSEDAVPGYTSTSQVYCNDTTGRSGTTVVAGCLDENDLPVAGGCRVDGDEQVALASSRPVQWDSQGSDTALWECLWTANGQPGVADGTPVVVASGNAYICCVAVP